MAEPGCGLRFRSWDRAEVNRTALTTGGSGALGGALAKQIAGDGTNLVLTARREDQLDRLAGELSDRDGVATSVIPKDLADPEVPGELFGELQEEGLQVHTLVNTAGFGVSGPFVETPVRKETQMMQVNMVSLTRLVTLFVEPMVDRGEGVIVNTSGLAAYIPLPKLAVYTATRAYIPSFTNALAHELAGSGVQVTTLCPGSTDSDFFERAEREDTKLAHGSKMDPADAAERAWRGVASGNRIVKPGVQPKLLSQLPRILPETTLTSIGAGNTEIERE